MFRFKNKRSKLLAIKISMYGEREFILIIISQWNVLVIETVQELKIIIRKQSNIVDGSYIPLNMYWDYIFQMNSDQVGRANVETVIKILMQRLQTRFDLATQLQQLGMTKKSKRLIFIFNVCFFLRTKHYTENSKWFDSAFE